MRDYEWEEERAVIKRLQFGLSGRWSKGQQFLPSRIPGELLKRPLLELLLEEQEKSGR